MTAQKKITKATIKSFIKKTHGKMFIKTTSRFDGMTDGIESVKENFSSAIYCSDNGYNCGVNGVWMTQSSKNYFSEYSDDVFSGFVVSNCCGRFIIAVKK